MGLPDKNGNLNPSVSSNLIQAGPGGRSIKTESCAPFCSASLQPFTSLDIIPSVIDNRRMQNIELRLHSGVRSPEDLIVTVQDATFEYLLSSPSPQIRVSAYLDRDYPQVEANYAELFVQEGCQFESKIIKIIPGSKTRKDIKLPCLMQTGEQLIVLVDRSPIQSDQASDAV